MSHPLKLHIEEITPISDAEFEYVLSHFRYRKFRKHQFLVENERMVENDHFVLSGLIKQYYTSDEGKEHILQFAMETWWITDFHAYYKQKPATTNVDCLEESEVLCLSLENRNKLCSEMHKIEHFFRVRANNGYSALQRRIISLLDKDAKGRYEQLIELYPSLLQRVSKTLIASYLGVTRETLSRLNH